MNDSDICPKCKKPRTSTAPASITQWVSVCSCNLLKQSSSETGIESIEICSNCGKRVNEGRHGSLTQFVFRSDLCSCRMPNPLPRGDGGTASDDRLLHEEEEMELDEPGFPRERFKPLSLIGRGGTGAVYLCRDRLLKSKVAVKILRYMNDEQLLSFQAEARLTSALEHHSIIKIVDFGASDAGEPYMVLEYFPGRSLKSILVESGALFWLDARDIFIRVAEALAFAHGLGVFHRDVKPENILVARREGEWHVRIIDFGVAKFAPTESTSLEVQGKTLVGTPAYMSPDQSKGLEYDSRSEAYSLGCALFEALSGQPPFSGDSAMQLLARHANDPPADLADFADVPSQLAALVTMCLEKNPEDRPASMSVIVEQLGAIRSQPSIDEETVILKRQPKRGLSSFALVNLLAVLLLVGAASFFFMSGEKRRQQMSKPKKTSSNDLIFMPLELNDEGLRVVAERFDSSVLDLSGASVKGPGLKYFTDLPVKKLTVSGSDITDEGFGYIARFKSLEDLTASLCTISDEALIKLSRNKHVHSLNFANCDGITDRGMISLARRGGLKELRLSDTHITDATLEALADQTSLTTLSCPNTQISNAGLDRLPSSIKALRIHGCKRLEPGALSIVLQRCPRLTVLSIGPGGIVAGEVSLLARFEQLVDLSISECQFNNENMSDIAGLRHIRFVHFNRCKIQPGGLKCLSGAPPGSLLSFEECPGVTLESLKQLKRKMHRSCRLQLKYPAQRRKIEVKLDE